MSPAKPTLSPHPHSQLPQQQPQPVSVSPCPPSSMPMSPGVVTPQQTTLQALEQMVIPGGVPVSSSGHVVPSQQPDYSQYQQHRPSHMPHAPNILPQAPTQASLPQVPTAPQMTHPVSQWPSVPHQTHQPHQQQQPSPLPPPPQPPSIPQQQQQQPSQIRPPPMDSRDMRHPQQPPQQQQQSQPPPPQLMPSAMSSQPVVPQPVIPPVVLPPPVVEPSQTPSLYPMSTGSETLHSIASLTETPSRNSVPADIPSLVPEPTPTPDLPDQSILLATQESILAQQSQPQPQQQPQQQQRSQLLDATPLLQETPHQIAEPIAALPVSVVDEKPSEQPILEPLSNNTIVPDSQSTKEQTSDLDITHQSQTQNYIEPQQQSLLSESSMYQTSPQLPLVTSQSQTQHSTVLGQSSPLLGQSQQTQSQPIPTTQTNLSYSQQQPIDSNQKPEVVLSNNNNNNSQAPDQSIQLPNQLPDQSSQNHTDEQQKTQQLIPNTQTTVPIQPPFNEFTSIPKTNANLMYGGEMIQNTQTYLPTQDTNAIVNSTAMSKMTFAAPLSNAPPSLTQGFNSCSPLSHFQVL